MKCLVTGASGFVGGHVARMLVERGDTVRTLVRKSSRLENLESLGCELAYGDLQNPESLKGASQGQEILYHIAADYRLWSRDPEELYSSNVTGTINVLQAALDAGISKVVYTSTVGTLGNPGDGTPGTETALVSLDDMVGHYKRSKFLAEQEALRFHREHGLPIVIVNPSTPVGEGDIKPTPTGKIVVEFLNRKIPAYIHTGLNLVDVRDVAAGHLLAADKGKPGEKYILGNRNMTLREILLILERITDVRAPKLRIPYAMAYAVGAVDTFLFGTMMGREPHITLESVRMSRKLMYFDSAKAVRDLGLPQSSIEQALARAVEWFQTHGYARA